MVRRVNWPIRIVLVAALALGAAGCKKHKPSPDYAEAVALYDRLYADKLEDAYIDPGMAQVEELLARVPADSRDQQAAAELMAKIQAGRARISAENDARQKTIADALKPVDFKSGSEGPTFVQPATPPAPEPSPDAAVAAPDAGATQPLTGMTAAEFQRRFSTCFALFKPLEVTGQGLCDAYELKDMALCRERHPGFVSALVLTNAEKVVGIAPKSAMVVEYRYPDGGLADAGP